MLRRDDTVPAWPLYQMEVVRNGAEPDILAVIVRTRVRGEVGSRLRQNVVRLRLTRVDHVDRRAIDDAQREAHASLVAALMDEPVGGP